ncbi:septal ring lytic transglycosylase RlpA family protein [Simiduia agarivorans]|uniref:Endolytic peptidoglycan transglycosylase RlpA n=1 Tax=Simiduia agarivorans (strain DSM 21679 / JCM 13881 / BCRC 17597 / SA1) TaxID=1117647 RepID=K4KHM0_SIMAS|nr:septal ring lytic transglycosylase RlpA family protein [Simiduia agarivorans]AFU98614.1 lipoprotein A [Simiduia agarivorans SA1 = DSM 21679]
MITATQLSRFGLPLLLGSLLACETHQRVPSSQAPETQSPASRYQVEKDYGPDAPLDVSHVPDAIPRVEPRTAAGNKSPYSVLGKTYSLLPADAPYAEEGIASWYGKKFHGHQTSNGEVYDMYAMTAAHKTLRIPTYVKVTNLDNGASVIVRVNDRGPFHDDRIIDLSYSAARKLGYAETGTARVRVEAIDARRWGSEENGNRAQAVAQPPKLNATQQAAAPVPDSVEGFNLPPNTFLQAGAFSTLEAANQLKTSLNGLTHFPVLVARADKNSLYRVRIGPISNNYELMQLRELITQKGGVRPHVVYQ